MSTAAKIIGWGSYLPEKVLWNRDMETMVDTSDEWITERTGIKKRHVAADGEYTSDLCVKALRAALARAKLESTDLDGIIVATTTPDVVFPATATIVQHKLGIKNGFAFDINAVCAGFVHAMGVASDMIKAGSAKRLAVIGAETLSRIVDWSDRGTCVLFGDGAGALILEAGKGGGVIDYKLECDGSDRDILHVPGGVSQGDMEAKISMNGREVFRHAVSRMSASMRELLQRNGLQASDIDYIVPHQANWRIMAAIAKKMKLDEKQVISTVAEHANTSAASIPLAFAEVADSFKPEQKIIFTAIGAGMVWGSVLLEM
jgi:3-oxoacyl-[acyl-carrier-protein] synthase-3